MFANITLSDVVLVAAAVVAIIGLVLALLTPKGRDTVALLGLRVADALVSLIEKLLSDPALLARLDAKIDKGVERTMALDPAFSAELDALPPDTERRGVITAEGMAQIDLDRAFVRFREARRDAEREIFKDTLWQTFTGDDND